jgi:hypothetical protein
VRLLMHDQLPPASALSLRGRLANWGPWLGVAGLAAAILFGLQWSQQRSDTVALAEQLAHSQQQLSEMQQTLSALQTADAVAASAAAAPNDVSSGAVDEPDANEMLEPVPFGELPLAGARLERVSALLSRLSAQGFRGVLQVRSIPGRFCMITNSAGIPVLPSDATPYSKCEQIGSSPDDNGSVSPRQSVAFANMVSIARQTAAGKIDVRITAGSADEVATPYPPVNDSLTAGEWNRVAAANNRVELHWQPMR